MKVTTIVPLYNEGKTVEKVLQVLNESKLISEIVIVNDASTDDTLEKITKFKSKKTKIISLKKNLGKSGAVKVATENLNTDIIFFCDGDLHNFKKEHIEQILQPMKPNKLTMSAGIRDYGPIMNFLSKTTFPLITGERALNYSIFENVKDDPLMKDYGLEVILNHYCKKNKIPIYKNIMKGLRQTNKHIKRKRGVYILLKQSLDVALVIVKLNLRNLFKVKKKVKK